MFVIMSSLIFFGLMFFGSFAIGLIFSFGIPTLLFILGAMGLFVTALSLLSVGLVIGKAIRGNKKSGKSSKAIIIKH